MLEEQRLDPGRHNRKAFRCGVEALDRFLAQQAGEYGLPAQTDSQDERVWSDLCHVLFNVKEFLFLQ